MKKYKITLTDEERAELEALTRKGTCGARKLKRALILLAAADGDTDEAVAGQARVHVTTVERVRQRCVEDGIAAALTERPRPGQARKLNGHQEAHLVALACSAPPAGRQGWTMQLLADKLVELHVVEQISDETVRVTLKKGRSSPGSTNNGVCRPWAPSS